MKYPTLHYDYSRGVTPQVAVLLDRILGGQIDAHTAAVALDGRFDATLSLQLRVMIDYVRWGRQVFVLGPGFQQMLAKTKLGNVPRERLNFPYPCFYLALQDSPWPINVPETGSHQVSGLYARLTPTEDQPNLLTIFVWGAENDRSRFPGDDATVWVRLDLDEAYKDGGTLEGYLDEVLAEGDETSSPGMGEEFLEDDQVKETHKTMVRLLRVVLNMTMYIQSDKAETKDDTSLPQRRETLNKEIEGLVNRAKNKKKGEKRARPKRRELEALPDARITWLAQDAEKRFSALINGATSRVAGKKRIPHWVRGHWWPSKDTTHHRAHERWVMPHPRCVEGGQEVPARQYRLKEDSDTR